MLRVADYIAQTLAAHGIRHVFMVTGGGAMHLNDAFGRCRELTAVCCHHEQACAMAAEGYFRVTNHLAAVNVTTGPGSTNAITGVYGAYVDSMGMVVISSTLTVGPIGGVTGTVGTATISLPESPAALPSKSEMEPSAPLRAWTSK